MTTKNDKRKQIESEVKADLVKPYEQLLIDIHDEILHTKRPPVDNIRHSLKRMSSLFAKMGMDNEKTQRRMNKFTWVVGIFTIINVVIYILTLIRPQLAKIFSLLNSK